MAMKGEGEGADKQAPGDPRSTMASQVDAPDVEVLAELVASIAGPVKDATKVAHREQTKRLEIWSGVLKFAINRGVWVLLGLIGLAGVAIWQNHPEVAVNLVIAVVGFAGGFGLGRGSTRPDR